VAWGSTVFLDCIKKLEIRLLLECTPFKLGGSFHPFTYTQVCVALQGACVCVVLVLKLSDGREYRSLRCVRACKTPSQSRSGPLAPTHASVQNLSQS
jgi:hypothetical protein